MDISAIFTTIVSAVTLLSQDFLLIGISQVATAIAGSVIGPAVMGITHAAVNQAVVALFGDIESGLR